MRKRVLAAGALLFAVLSPTVAVADMPWPTAPAPGRYDYENYLRSNTPPNEYSASDYKITSSSDPQTGQTAQELGGVMGASLDKAFQVSTGRPDIHIAVLDSGIMWNDGSKMADLRNKIALNWAELPPPQLASGTSACTGVQLPPRTQKLPSPGFPICYDLNQDGAFTVDDYSQDPRVNLPNHPHWCCGSGNAAQNLLTPEDLIQVFSCFDAGNAEPVGHFVSISATGPRICDNGAQNVDNDGNGFAHDIAGWNFMEHTNDPYDEPNYGHGSGEARDSNAEANNGGALGTCPSCMVMPLKVGDSFIADVNDFAQAVLYATDNGVQVVQEALGTLNNSAISQAAVDYAYAKGTVVIASAADESAGHHNQPGFANHTVVVNSVTQTVASGPGTKSYLLMNGCTNYGGHTIVAVESGSCSSEATGLSAGYAGLIYSTARNEVRLGHMPAYDAARGIDISPNEVKQIMAGTADDIDFEDATPPKPRGDSGAVPSSTAPCAPVTTDLPGTPANYNNPQAAGERFHSIAGWDQYFGYGRANANCEVRAVLGGTNIPPEVEVNSPKWFSNVDTLVHPNVAVSGRVAATRATSYRYKVQIAYGVQPHPDEWTTVYTSPTETGPVSGTLATLTADQVNNAMLAYTGKPHVVNPNGDQTDWKVPPYTTTPGQNQWDQFTFTVRVQATDNRNLTGEDRKSLQAHHDAGSGLNNGSAVSGFPKDIGTGGESSPVLVDLLGDNENVLVYGTSSGEVHALRSDGSELPGWPAHVSRLCASQLPDDLSPCTQRQREPAFSDPALSAVASHSYAAVLGTVAVGDLDRSGRMQVVAADYQGYISVFEVSSAYCASIGQSAPCLRPGFPTHINFDYSRQGLPGLFNRDVANRVQFGFAAAPTLADLGDGRLSIIDGALDRHLYVFGSDGSTRAGFPLLIQDPTKVASVDPGTHRLHLTANSGAFYGTKIVSSPAVGDLLGDGKKEIILGRNEEYNTAQDGGYNATTDTVGGGLTSTGCLVNNQTCLISAANGRGYAVFSDGYCHGVASPCATALADTAWNRSYVNGWPVKLGIFDHELLPTVGSGVDTAPSLINTTCPLNNSPGLKVGIFSADGPVYVFGSDGKSCYGQGPGPDGPNTLHDRALGGALLNPSGTSNSTDPWAANAFGTGAFGDLTGNGDLVLVTATTGLNKAVDAIAPGHQLGAQTQVTAWSLSTGQLHGGYPRYMNDLQFLSGPGIADIVGDGSQEVLQGSATSDMRAVKTAGTGPAATATEVAGWDPKNTGGWIVSTPVISTFGPVQRQRVVTVTREGSLFAWETTAPACAGASWPKYKHDIWNTGQFEAKAGRPATIQDLTATMSGNTAQLQFTVPHGNLFCGNPASYEIRYSASGPIDDGNWSTATLVASADATPAAGAHAISLRPNAAPAVVVPGTPGQQQTITVANLPAGPLWFEVQAVNDATRTGGNLAAVSNPASTAGPPGGVPEVPAVWLLACIGAAVLALTLARRRRAASAG
ncbi:MAG: hypothetical protein ACR2MY_11395 [Candidatus Dormibacteria bacterium]